MRLLNKGKFTFTFFLWDLKNRLLNTSDCLIQVVFTIGLTVLKIVFKLRNKSASSIAQLQNASTFVENAVLSNLIMCVMEILQ